MKTGKAHKGASKITISVWSPVWSRLEKKLDAACLKRDAYIGTLINRELDYLEEEMPIANSEEAEQFIDKQLRALLQQNFTPLSIALQPEIAKKLEKVCAERRIVRDSLFNRLFLFLAFGPQMAGMLLFPGLVTEGDKGTASGWTNTVWSEYKHEGPFSENVFEPFLANQDPLWPIRACFDIIEERDHPDYVDWTDPESRRVVKMVKWVPDHVLCLPYRFYTAVLTDHDLRKTASAPARHAAQGQTGNKEADRAYHNLYGLNCYLPNFHVPRHPDQKAVEELLLDL
jgi:hypothetical protein